MNKVLFLQRKHPRFIYERYEIKKSGKDLMLFFYYLLEPTIRFRPTLLIRNIDWKRYKKLPKDCIENFVFHLGLMEIPSYWKTACSPKIIIQAGNINKNQIRWWERLLRMGMGEFFYINRINFTKQNFIRIISSPFPNTTVHCRYDGQFRKRVLIPMGGGKDSIITFEMLKKSYPLNCFTLNPSIATKRILKIAHVRHPIVCERTFDPKLISLNTKGYLNGHTPFSAYLAFLSAFCAFLFNYRIIAISQEKSTSEGNVMYRGMSINHQYSKTREFENTFHQYLRTYLAKYMRYFSLLRPFWELQIAKRFSRFPQYFYAFLSCNRGAKKNQWCNACPKCLSTWIVLSPFIKESVLEKIFESNLWENKNLSFLLDALLNKNKIKPFECIGTRSELKKALSLYAQQHMRRGEDLPYLIQYAQKQKYIHT